MLIVERKVRDMAVKNPNIYFLDIFACCRAVGDNKKMIIPRTPDGEDSEEESKEDEATE